ncbi:MAG: SDR family NAD(P)-dependent oxidoreductase [Eubacteriales bacterium]
MCDCALEKLAAMSNKYGSDADYVLAGGGNTSYKTDTTLYIKGSGTALATIKPEQFVRMDRASLAKMWTNKYPEDEDARESAVLSDMMNSREKGESGRPSVETLLHDLFRQKYVLHVHPSLVNGLTCSVDRENAMKKYIPEAVWVDSSKPGYILANKCRDAISASEKASGVYPNVLFLRNHGIFFAADTTEELDSVVSSVMNRLDAAVVRRPDFSEISYDIDRVAAISPAVRMMYGEGKCATVRFFTNRDLLDYDPDTKSFTPDHIVYYKAKILVMGENACADCIKTAFDKFVAENGYKPRIIYVRGLGAFACGDTLKAAKTAQILFLDTVKIWVYAQSFGGASAMPDELIDFITNWEVESYRSKVSASATASKRLENKIAIVTGAAQGFGRGIAEALADEGAYVVIADMNYDGAKATSDTIPNSYALFSNVSDEASVKSMIDKTVVEYGGLDLFVNNAGIAKAGSLEDMQKSTFELVTAVNYTGYFLCTKYASRPMKIQRAFCPGYMADIVEINSKSGLAGSNKNFAYAGSKFGGIGLTQSFALELCEYGIKVNAVCPGNFLNGPLWSDPEKGLFVQYLRAGKVPGAKTVEDVRRYYESKVPMNRGCETIDVARAVFYIVEQKYETGQAIPVTGGQEMLN